MLSSSPPSGQEHDVARRPQQATNQSKRGTNREANGKENHTDGVEGETTTYTSPVAPPNTTRVRLYVLLGGRPTRGVR